MTDDRTRLIAGGGATLGIELGSTRIKAVLVGDDHTPVASGSHEWENAYVDGVWTYSLDAVRDGLRAAYADLVDDCDRRHGVRPDRYRAIGVSAMMHGYLAFDTEDALLVPFRTWRNTSTTEASDRLGRDLGVTIPLRWSIAHLYQAVLDDEAHVPHVTRLTTLAGYVHHLLTGRHVLGVGDASGMFPVDAATRDYDTAMLATTQRALGTAVPDLRALLPDVLVAGDDAGELTPEGAAYLDPTGALRPGIPCAPPEGDAGTGMVATNAVAPRTGNVSVGTSIFAMVVLERPLGAPHPEVDLVTTPAGDAVAMVHCNNGASELAAWAGVFARFAAASGTPLDTDAVYRAMLDEAATADPDAGGVLAYNFLAAEPVAGIDAGRPLVVRSPGSTLSLGNLVRAEVYAAYATLAIGMRVLDDEGVRVDRLLAHGGVFRTPGVGQRLLAAALGTPVAVQDTAGEGGAWGMAVLAAYAAARRDDATAPTLDAYLRDRVFAATEVDVTDPDASDAAGFADYLGRFRAGLDLQRTAAALVAPDRTGPADDRADGADRTGPADDSADRADPTRPADDRTRSTEAEPSLPAGVEVTR